MLFVFPPIFVADTTLIYGYNFAGPLKELRNCISCFSHMVIILFNTSFSRSAFSTYSFGKLVLVCFLCFLLVPCFESNATICMVIII